MIKKVFQLIKFAFLFFLLINIIGCIQSNQFNSLKYPTLTVQPEYLHYTPQNNSEINLEFDYPFDWILQDEEEYYDTGIYSIQIFDPRFIQIPTQVPFKTQVKPINLGKITIIKQSLHEGQSLETVIDSYRNGHNNESWIEQIKEYSILIDGRRSQVLEFQLDPFEDNSYSESMFEKTIFFQVDQDIYQIIFIEAINDFGNDFDSRFDYLLNSIRVFTPVYKE